MLYASLHASYTSIFRYGTTLAYTPMLHARIYLEDANYR
jgi:hypothetical protein